MTFNIKISMNFDISAIALRETVIIVVSNIPEFNINSGLESLTIIYPLMSMQLM